MKRRLLFGWISACHVFFILVIASCGQKNSGSVTVPVTIDHNRMLIDAEMKSENGTWRKVRLWVDSGNPVFTINTNLAHNLGLDQTESGSMGLTGTSCPELRIGGMMINTKGVQAKITSQPFWIYSTMDSEGNLPSVILKNYDIVFDYPNKKLTIADPGSIKHKGIKTAAIIHPETGIVQISVEMDKDTLSFALDIGASYSFISDEVLSEYTGRHPEWSNMKGTAGCANMWGWWPANEQLFTVVRIDEMKFGNIMLEDFGIAGVPSPGPEGPSLGEWYSKKTVKPVSGFLGANVLKPYRIGIDYSNQEVWFQKDSLFNDHDMDIVGISLKQLPDSAYQVVGIVEKSGQPVAQDIQPGDIILSIDNFEVKGATMGRVVDALRGTPRDAKTILISRDGMLMTVNECVMRLL